MPHICIALQKTMFFSLAGLYQCEQQKWHFHQKCRTFFSSTVADKAALKVQLTGTACQVPLLALIGSTELFLTSSEEIWSGHFECNRQKGPVVPPSVFWRGLLRWTWNISHRYVKHSVSRVRLVLCNAALFISHSKCSKCGAWQTQWLSPLYFFHLHWYYQVLLFQCITLFWFPLMFFSFFDEKKLQKWKDCMLCFCLSLLCTCVFFFFFLLFNKIIYSTVKQLSVMVSSNKRSKKPRTIPTLAS